jgi:hypothetical protein
MSGKPNPDKDERVNIPLHPETALRALLTVDQTRSQRTRIRTATASTSATDAYQVTSAHTV